MSIAQLARIQLLVKVARLEIAHLRPTDYRLRWAILCDLNDLLKELRAPIEMSARKPHGLPMTRQACGLVNLSAARGQGWRTPSEVVADRKA